MRVVKLVLTMSHDEVLENTVNSLTPGATAKWTTEKHEDYQKYLHGGPPHGAYTNLTPQNLFHMLYVGFTKNYSMLDDKEQMSLDELSALTKKEVVHRDKTDKTHSFLILYQRKVRHHMCATTRRGTYYPTCRTPLPSTKRAGYGPTHPQEICTSRPWWEVRRNDIRL
jgi:hypothetical protein